MRLARDETLRWRFGLAARERVVANRIIAFFTSVKLHDYRCTLKVYRREFIERTRLPRSRHVLASPGSHAGGRRKLEATALRNHDQWMPVTFR